MCMEDLRKPIDAMVRFDSDNMEGIARALNWDWLEEEAKTNQKNPGRAIGKAAGYALGSYLGGLGAGGSGAAGGAAGTAAGTALTSGLEAGATMTAEELAKLAAQEMMAEGLMGTAQGAASQAPSLMGGMMQQAPQGLMNTMEAGMMDTGYTPSSLLNAVKNTGETTPLGQNLMNFGQQQGRNMMSGGMMNQASANMADPQKRQMVQMGMNMMNPQEPQQPMPMAPPRQQAPQEPLPNPYGDSLMMDTPPPGMSPEEWERLKMQLMMGRR